MYYGNLSLAEYERHFFAYPHLHGMTPFRIWGNLYFAGDDSVGIHLIDTGDGLVVLDTGYPQMQGFTIQSIWALGFRPEQIRLILHTHAHFDHIGATNLLKTLSGAKTAISEADARMMRERPELTMADKSALFEPDLTIKDGDKIEMGNTSIRVQNAAGHTAGTLAVFISLTDEKGARKIAGMHGGVGLNTLTLNYTRAHHLPEARDQFVESLNRLEDERVDILLGNHTRQNDTPGKYLRKIERPDDANPFVDDDAWRRFIQNTRGSFQKMLTRESTE